MQIEIKPEDIDEHLKKAIIESAVGKGIQAEIVKELNRIFSGYDSPIKDLIRGVIRKHIEQIVSQQEQQIREAVLKLITPDVIESIIDTGVSNFMRKM